MLKITTSGSTKRTQTFFKNLQAGDQYSGLENIAQRGVAALQAATPIDTSATANAWSYEIQKSPSGVKISWINTNAAGGAHVAIMLQYGHGTGTGGYVAGRDYINPAIKPVFDEIANEVWRKVTSA